LTIGKQNQQALNSHGNGLILFARSHPHPQFEYRADDEQGRGPAVFLLNAGASRLLQPIEYFEVNTVR
jgi:hypothetical protein